MTDNEREQVRLTKILKSTTLMFPSATLTGAQAVLPKINRNQVTRQTRDLPAALGRPPESASEDPDPSKGDDTCFNEESSAIDTRTVILDGYESDSTGPTVRKTKRPAKPVSRLRDPDRRRLIESPLKIKINSRKRDCQRVERSDLMDTSPDLGSDHESVSLNNEDLICLDDEPKVKCKNELLTFDQVDGHPDLENLTSLLLFGVETTIESTRKKVWPPMTRQQEATLQKTY